MVYAFDNNLHTNVMRSKDRSSKQLLTAKQKACIRWIISKAYSDAAATALREPYYRDNDNKERLKPQIVHSLANTEIYCLALSNIYSDPYYSCLNHQEVLQLLTRKGVSVVPPADASLTETVLVQTAPLKMSAHMAIIEAIMALFIKEVLIPEKVVEVVNRFWQLTAQDTLPTTAEEAALFWISKCCVKFKHRIESDLYKFDEKDTKRMPILHIIEDLSDLNDGCALAAIISFYCPDELKWTDICLNDSMSASDRMYNVQLVQYFCEEKLEHNICFLSVDDILHLHETIRPNILAFIADLLYLFEIRPASCVSKPAISDLAYSDSEEKPYKRTPDLPSPAEMKSRSLQHSDWVYNDYRNSRPEKKYRRPLLRQRSYDRSDEEDMYKHYRSMEFGIPSDHFPDVSFGKPYKTLSVSNLSKPLKNYKLQESQRSRRFSKSKSPSRSERSDTSSDLFSLEREKNSPTLITNFVKLAKMKDNTFQATNLHEIQAPSPTINIAFKPKDTINPLLASQKTLRQLNDSSSIKECLIHKIPPSIESPKKTTAANDDVHDLIRDLRLKLNSQKSNLDEDNKTESEAWSQQTLPKSEKTAKEVTKDINSNFKESRKLNGSARPVSEDNVDVSDLKHDLEQIIRRLEVHEKSSSRRALNTEKQQNERSVDLQSAVDTLPLQTHPKATPYNAQHESNENNSAEITPSVTNQMRLEDAGHVAQSSVPLVAHIEPPGMNMPKRGKWGLPAVPIAANDYEYQWIVAPVAPQYEHPYYPRYVSNTYDMYSMHMYSHPPPPPPPQPRSMYGPPEAYYRSPPIPPPNLNRGHSMYPQATEMLQMSNNRCFPPFPPSPQSMIYQQNTESSVQPSVVGNPIMNNRNENHNQTVDRRAAMSQNIQDQSQQQVHPISRSNSEVSSNDSILNKTGSSSDSFKDNENIDYNQKGFFIHVENDRPSKSTPKPVARTKSRHKQKHHSTITRHLDNQNGFLLKSSKDVLPDETISAPVSQGVGFVIGEDLQNLTPSAELELAKKKENVIIQSLRRKQEQEEKRLEKQHELRRIKEEERLRKEESDRKKEEDRMRRQTILEQYRQKKCQDESDSGLVSMSKESSRNNTLVSQRHGKGRRHSSASKQGSKNRDFSSLDRKSSRSSNEKPVSRNFGSTLSLNGEAKKSYAGGPRKLPSVSHLPSVPSNIAFESPGGSDDVCDIESTSSSEV